MNSPLPTPQFLAAPGDTMALLQSTDWNASTLGPPASWPTELVTVVRLMMGSAFPMFVAWGPQLGFLYNEAYASILGARHPAAFGQPFAQIWHEIWPDISPVVDAALAGRSSYFDDLPLLVTRKGYPEQTWFTFSYSPLQDASGAIAGICCTCVETTARVLGERRQAEAAHGVDQTDRKLAEAALRSSEERYRTLFESMDQAFCLIEMIFDEAGKPVDFLHLEVNPLHERHSGMTGLVGKKASETVAPLTPFWYETLGRVAVTGEAVRFENQAVGRWFDVYATRSGGPDSRKVALLFRDVSERKQADEQLRKLAADLAEADRRKTEFLATLAHELRNPLAPIRSGLGLMGMSGSNPAAVAKIRDMMERQVSHMVRLIDDLLDIARIGGGKMELKKEWVALADVLHSAVETSLPLIESWRHRLDVDLPAERLTVEVDPTRIAQVVANLLNNAAKYTPPGGRIALSARVEGEQVAITVSDNGVGIPADELASVFEMFNQVGRHKDRAHGGLGIGLSLVRQLVQMHGGAVSAVSGGPGQGSAFTVRLALASGAGAEANTVAPPATGDSLRVMVVDDNADAADVMAAVLELNGHVTKVAHGGHEALEAAAAFRPEVAFLDIGMPGMDGYETAQALRCLPGMGRLVLVALTGWGAQDDRARTRKAGFDHHLTKPADFLAVQELLAGCARQLRQ